MHSAPALLILDLDETLIYSSEEQLARPADFRTGDYYSYKRPELDTFTDEVKKHFRVAVWTSSSPDYGRMVVDNIFPEDYPLEFVWARDRCTFKRDLTFDTFYYAKNLAKAKRRGFSLERMLIVDNTPEKVRMNYGNAIYIKSWYGESDDRELPILAKYLESIREYANYRKLEKRGWRSIHPS